MEQRRHGAAVLHVIGLFYMFVALAIVCDEFFVPALEVISETLELSPDVAGATFMAAGGSAPEFFTSMIGAVVLETDIGVGTIVGSAVFNVLFVIGACALVAPTALQLTWFPLARDSTFYTVDLFALIFVLSDSEVRWYESLVLFLLYVFYIVFMRYSSRLEGRFITVVEETHVDDVGAESEQQCWAKSRAGDGPTPVVPIAAPEECQAEIAHPGRVMDETSSTNVLCCGDDQYNQDADINNAMQPRSASKRSSTGSRKGSKISRQSTGSNLQAWKERSRSSSHLGDRASGSGGGHFKHKSFRNNKSQANLLDLPDPHDRLQAHSKPPGEGAQDKGKSCSGGVTSSTGSQAPAGQSAAEGQEHRRSGGSEDSSASLGKVLPPPERTEPNPTPPTSTVPDLSVAGGGGAAAAAVVGDTSSTVGGHSLKVNTNESSEAETCCLSIVPDGSTSGPPFLDVSPGNGRPKPSDAAEEPGDGAETGGDEKKEDGDGGGEEEEEDNQPLDLSPPDRDAGWKDWVWYVGTFPIVVLLVFSIPDVRREGLRKYFPLSFFLSICWIAGFTYWMVWFAIVLGETCGIPDHIMGLTVLASGTSVPDLLTSVIVARQGHGDMAVSSSIGSNIFDVTVGLPVPWLVYTALRSKPVTTSTIAPEIGVLMLVFMLMITIGTIMCNRWVMTKLMGVSMLFLYLLFEVASVLMAVAISPEEQAKLRIFSR